MIGIINNGLRELILTKYGAEAWDLAKSLIGFEEKTFALNKDYPDELTTALFKAAVEACKISEEEIMVEFGKFMVPNFFKKYYSSYFVSAGSSPRELLLSMNSIHEKVGRDFPGAEPPRFEYEQPPDGRLLMHYYSKRQLCAVLRGMILGVGALFNQDLKVTEKQCTRKGDSHCVIEVAFP